MPTIVDNSETRVGSGRLSSQGGVPVYEETFHYIILADNLNQTRLDILQTDGLPLLNISVGPSGSTVCKSKSAERRESHPLYWDVTCDFSSEVEENDGDPNTDPNTWIPVYETKYERLQEVALSDVNGVRITNSAGQPFEQGLTVTRFIPVWDFYQFEPASVSDFTIIGRNESVNSTIFRGCAEKTLLLVVVNSVLGFYYGMRRRLTHYQLKYNWKDWRHRRMDVGTTHFWNALRNEIVPYLVPIDPAKEPTADNTELVLGPLDGTGLPAGGFHATWNTAINDGTPPSVVAFDVYPAINFSQFLR